MSCLRVPSLFRRRDSFEEHDVGGKGVVKKIPIEMKPRRTLATSLRSVGSFGKRQKGASLRSALSVELEGPEIEKIRKEWEMYRLNKENEIANFRKKEQKLENENRLLRGELQALQKTLAKLRYERDEAFAHEQQALERAASFEADRDKIQRQFKIFRESKEEELQNVLRTKRDLEIKLNVYNRVNGGGQGTLDDIHESDARYGEFTFARETMNNPSPTDWWTNSCQDREPSLSSNTQLQFSATMPAQGGLFGERHLLGWTAGHRKVSSASSLFGRGGLGVEVSGSQFEMTRGVDVDDVSRDESHKMEGTRHVDSSSLSQLRKYPSDLDFPTAADSDVSHASLIRLYVSAPSDSQTEVALLKSRFGSRLRRMCDRRGKTFLFVHLPCDTFEMDIEVSAVLHAELPKSSLIFVGFLKDRVDTFTKDEIYYGFLQNPSRESLRAIFSLSTAFDGITGSSKDAEELKTELRVSEGRATIFEATSIEDAVSLVGNEVEKIVHDVLGISSDEEEQSEGEFDSWEDRERQFMTRLCGCSGIELDGSLEQREALANALNSLCELGFEEHYVELTNHLTSAGPLPPLLIHGASGTGKSLLLAKWLSLLIEKKAIGSQTQPFLPLLLYHSVTDSQSISGDPHYAVRRFAAKLAAHFPGAASITSNTTRLVDEFPKLLESVSSRVPGGVIIVLDHADRFREAEAQLAWLLDPLPVDVRVFVASTDETCPKAWRSWPTLRVEPLNNNQIRELMFAQFKSVNKTFNEEHVRLVQRHCRSSATTSPLFISVLAAFIQWKSTFELDMSGALTELLRNSNLVDLTKSVLMSLEDEYNDRLMSPGMLRRILLLLFASRCGLSENCIFDIVNSDGEIPWHFWALICDILIETRVLQYRVGLLVFGHPSAREAVRQLYLETTDSLIEVRKSLIQYHFANVESLRAMNELPWLLLQVGEREGLEQCMRRVQCFTHFFTHGRTNELLYYWTALTSEPLNSMSEAYREALKAIEDDLDNNENSASSFITPLRVIAVYEALGRFFRDMKQFNLAMPPFERALELRESLDPDDPEVGRLLVHLGQINAEWRNYATAESLFKTALELFEAVFGDDNSDVAGVLEALALLHQRQGKHDSAQPLQRRADSIRMKIRRERMERDRQRDSNWRGDNGSVVVAKPTSLSTPASKNSVQERRVQIASKIFNVAVQLCQRQKHADAFPLFEQALSVFETTLGPSHPMVAETLRNAAMVKFHLNELEAAAELYKKATNIKEKSAETERRFDARLSAKSRRFSSDTMSTIKVGDDHISVQRASSTR